jgi:nucleoside-diphosphate-sugar epimerase
MRVLLTGAFGSVGRCTLDALLAAGHHVRCFELPSKAAKKLAARYTGKVELAWGDIRRPSSVAAAVEGVEHVLHLAAVIPPGSDVDPALAYHVNVGGLRNLLEASRTARAPITFCSTGAVYGRNLQVAGPRSADEPLHPEDSYGRQKAECEAILRASDVPHSIFRLGVTPPASGAGFDPFVFEFHPYTRVEFSHPEDVARALARSVGNREVLGRTLLIAGGAHNRFFYRDWLNLALERAGIGRFPLEAFGPHASLTDWMDTRESQRLLDYQQKSYDDYLDELTRSLGGLRHVTRALAPWIRSHLLAKSPYYQANLRTPLRWPPRETAAPDVATEVEPPRHRAPAPARVEA